MAGLMGGMLFENTDWRITSAGLEHKGTGYAIERVQVGRRHPDGCWAWPPHMLEKNWVEPAAFAEAFSAAVRLFGLDADDALESTFADAGWVQVASGWRRRTAEVVPHPALAGPDAEARRSERRTEARRRRHG